MLTVSQRSSEYDDVCAAAQSSAVLAPRTRGSAQVPNAISDLHEVLQYTATSLHRTLSTTRTRQHGSSPAHRGPLTDSRRLHVRDAMDQRPARHVQEAQPQLNQERPSDRIARLFIRPRDAKRWRMRGSSEASPVDATR